MSHRGIRRVACAAAVAALIVTVVGGIAPTSGASSSVGGGRTYTIGVLTDLTGLAATNSSTTPLGVKAGVGVAAKEGYKIRYVVADTETSPSGALSGAQKLVEQDHVFAVIASSAVTFGAAPFLASEGIPVVGSNNDSTEWVTDRNMFSILGTGDYTKVYSQSGTIFKKLGVTNLASIGYSVSPSSADAAEGEAVSAKLAGIKVGYLNANFPFGSTNVAPAALAIKSAGANGLAAAIETNTEFALINTLRDEGVSLKGVLMSTGYGGDLTSGGPGATQTAQGLYFGSPFEPFELRTPATEMFHNALKTYAGVAGDPTLAEYIGYLSVNALVQGLKAAGSHPTQASVINAMLKINDYNGAGLFGSHTMSFAMNQRGKVSGVDNCEWVTKYSGSTFHLLPGLDPICGHTIPGKTISSSS